MEYRKHSGARPRLCALCVVLALAGCADFLDNASPLASDASPAVPVAPVPWRDRPIGQDQWARTFPDAKHPEVVSAHRWRHATLEGADGALLAEREELGEALESSNELAAANAQLLMVRHFPDDEDFAATEILPELASNGSLPVHLRCAAADTLADASEEGQALALELLNEQAELSAQHSSKQVPELHEELLRGVARHQPPTVSPAFATSLLSDSPKVRAVAAEAWAAGPAAALPERLADLTRDPDAAVRCAALRSLAAARHPRTLEVARNCIFDPQLEVHLAAIAALGKVPDPEALELLHREAKADGNLIRATAIVALAEQGDINALLAAATDRDANVREAAAAGLARVEPEQGRAVARELIADRSMAVRRKAIDAIATWPLPESGPLLFSALEDRALDTRQSAAKALAKHWPAAEEFRPTATAEERATLLVAMRARFPQDVGGDARIAALPATGTTANLTPPMESKSLDELAAIVGKAQASGADSVELRDALDQLRTWPGGLEEPLLRLADERGVMIPECVYALLYPADLADESPLTLANWSTASPSEKRELVGWLVDRTDNQPYRPLVVRRMIERVMVESDPLLWQNTLELCRVQSDPHVRRFAAAALGHESPEVRRRACEYFSNYAGEDAVPWLQATLGDEASYVAAAAARAMAQCGRPADLTALADLTARDDRDCQLAAAVALTRFGDERGRAALERLAYDPDVKVRIRAARTMGELAEPEFTATLIALLDDELGVRRAALASLPLVADHAPRIAEDATSQAATAAWKRWAVAQ